MDARFGVAEDALERWNNDFPLWLSDETRRIFVAETRDAVEGFVTAHRSAPPPIYEAVEEVYIDELYIVPEVRRQGMGTQLVGAVRQWAEQLRAERLRFQTVTTNAAGRAFWESQGATPFATAMTISLEPTSGSEPDQGAGRIGF